MPPRISVVIPAHNEERHLPACLAATASAAEALEEGAVETIVALNRCDDRTEEIARAHGCRIAREDARNLSLIRNAGAALARGRILVTCDADSRMHPLTFSEIDRKLATKRLVGGGALVLPERWSPGIVASGLAILPYILRHHVSFGLFWCLREDFEAIGGFDPALVTVEDLDFARRLRAHGRTNGRHYGTLWRAPLVTSCRKFDQFGDWYFFRHPGFVRRAFRGTDRAAADSFWYDARSGRKD